MAPSLRRMTALFAFSCGLIAANIYYSQPLAGPISQSLGIPAGAAGLVVTLTQIGYGLGLLFLVPLGDLVDSRRLVLTLIGLATVGLIGTATAAFPAMLFMTAALVGLGSVAVQVLVPLAAHFAPAESRGQMVGNVLSGLMLGIMLARPISSTIAQVWSWHAVFYLSAAAMVLLMIGLYFALPSRPAPSKMRYTALLASMATLAIKTPILQQRALIQASLFAAFSLFWTVTPLWLASPAFNLSQGEIALVALAGVAGAIAAPIAGRMADRGWSTQATILAMLLVSGAFILPWLAATQGANHAGSPIALGLVVVAAIALDFGATTHLVIGQRAIFALGDEVRSRLNGLMMAIFFSGGAAGSACGAWAFAHLGWNGAAWIGLALPVLPLIAFIASVLRRRQQQDPSEQTVV